MTRSELIDMFKTVAKNHSPNAYSDDLITHFLDEGQIDIVLRTGCYTASKTLTSISGEDTYKLGSDIMKVLWVAYDNKQIDGTTVDQAHMFGDYPGAGSGTPSYYFIQMNNAGNDNEPILVFSNPPDEDSKNITVFYVKRPPKMWASSGTTSDPVIPEQYHRLIVEYALYGALWRDVKFETADRWKRQYDERVMRMVGEMSTFDAKRRKRWIPDSSENRQKSIRWDMRD